jgi:hypothetical protein
MERGTQRIRILHHTRSPKPLYANVKGIAMRDARQAVGSIAGICVHAVAEQVAVGVPGIATTPKLVSRLASSQV